MHTSAFNVSWIIFFNIILTILAIFINFIVTSIINTELI